jgi:hypothetical protein
MVRIWEGIMICCDDGDDESVKRVDAPVGVENEDDEVVGMKEVKTDDAGLVGVLIVKDIIR